MYRIVSILIIFCTIFSSCSSSNNQSENGDKEQKFPFLGRSETIEKEVDGEVITETVPHTIPEFSLVNQDSVIVNNEDLKGKVYVADFFFTSCPTICPKMKAQMLRVYQAYKDNDEVAIISHTIDPEFDTVAVLHDFAERLGVAAPKWNFVTGSKEEIYELGQKGYMVTAMEDENEAGGYIHSGAFILVDKEGHVRAVYDGTVAEDVDKLIADIPLLLATYED